MTRTVLITGATGYIGRHVVRTFLDHGYDVVGSTRDVSRLDDLKRDIEPALSDPDRVEALRLVELDLTSNEGWDRAMEGVDALIHTASPFPLEEPDDPELLIRPAVEGVERAFEAAARAGIRNIVLTSSVLAVTENGARDYTFDEGDWSDPDWSGISAYSTSKTVAERRAWELAEAHGLSLATINPGLVLGPPLGRDYGTSMALIERFLKGKVPVLARVGFTIVDVGDVALAHLRALEREEAQGHRHILADRFIWLREVAEAIKEALPGAKVSTRVAPDFVIKGLALFDSSAKSILPNLGRGFAVDNSRLQDALEIEPRDCRDVVRQTALWMKNEGIA